MEGEMNMAWVRSFGKSVASILGIVSLLGLSTPPLPKQQPLNGIDLKTPQEVSGSSLEIESFVGTLIIKTIESPNNLTLSAKGHDDELKKLTIYTDKEGESEIKIIGDKNTPHGDHVSLVLMITMPKQLPLELHMNYGKATLADHASAVKLAIEGNSSIATGTLGGDLTVDINGNGEISIANIDSTTRTTPLSPIKLSIQGDGKIKLNAFNYEDVKATINGNGLIVLNGRLHDGDFTINGTGRVEIAKVLGEVNQKINGSGAVVVLNK